MAAPTVSLSNGQKMPCLGLGTSEVEEKRQNICGAVKAAIDAGYRLFDTASVYQSEGLVGEAVRAKMQEGLINRDDIFIVTKLWINSHHPKSVVSACQESLKNLGLDYIDLYLIHWPMACPDNAENAWTPKKYGNVIMCDVDYVETWKAMEECVSLGLVKSIGLSNFNSHQIGRILAMAQIKPVVNQIECHLKFNQRKLRTFCERKGIRTMAFCPLGSPGFNEGLDNPTNKHFGDNPVVKKIADKYGKTTAQVALRYLVDIGTIPIPKSISYDRIQQNIDVFDFELTSGEIAAIGDLDCGLRLVSAKQYATHPFYPFHAEF